MRWEDESYVKLYRRDTADMLLWPWQSHAVWPNLLRKVDGSGLIDTGRRDEFGALSALLHLPREVVEAGIAGLIEDGCVERVDGGYLVRNFVEAQEAKKTDAQKKRDYREKQRERRRSQVRKITRPPVPENAKQGTGEDKCPPSVHQVSPVGDPPAQPSPAQLSSVTPPSEECAEKPAPPRRVVEHAPDPRHAPLVQGLCDVYLRERGVKYPFQRGRDAKQVSELLATGLDPPVIVDAFSRALRHVGYPSVSSLSELVTNLAHFVGKPNAKPADKGRAPESAKDWSSVNPAVPF